MKISRYLVDAQNRAKRRKSLWNIFLFALVFAIATLLWWLFAPSKTGDAMMSGTRLPLLPESGSASV